MKVRACSRGASGTRRRVCERKRRARRYFPQRHPAVTEAQRGPQSPSQPPGLPQAARHARSHRPSHAAPPPPPKVRLAYRHQRPYGHRTEQLWLFSPPRPSPISIFMSQALYRMAVFFLAPIFLVEGNTPPTCPQTFGRDWLAWGFSTNAHTGTDLYIFVSTTKCHQQHPMPRWNAWAAADLPHRRSPPGASFVPCFVGLVPGAGLDSSAAARAWPLSTAKALHPFRRSPPLFPTYQPPQHPGCRILLAVSWGRHLANGLPALLQAPRGLDVGGGK